MNKTVLVIGASGGIGKSVVQSLLEQGYSVIGTYLGTSISFEGDFEAVQLDLQDRNAIKDLASQFNEKQLYAVINCAGVCEYEGNNSESDLQVWDKTLEINLTSNYVLAKYFENVIEDMGRFIMISSTDAMYGGDITASYAASKAGVNSLVKSLSLMFKDRKISVNAIAPGWVDTRMIAGTGEEFIKKVGEMNPLKRIAKPEDIANVISFLLKPETEYVNGQVITVDGGYTNQDPTLLIEEDSL